MGKPAVPLRYKLIALCAAGLLACGLLPLIGYAADDESVVGPLAGPGYENDAQGASPDSDLSSAADGPTLASTLAGSATSIVSADVMLDAAEPIVGSFTVDGLTYAVDSDGLMLVAVDAAAVSDGAIAIPASVTFNDVTYPVTAVGPYAFYLSGATDVALPESIASVDDRAFRSSDVERVEVAPGNSNFASFDGALCSADKSRLLLIPEGRKGSVLLSCETEVVQASLFSHCSLVEAISVEEGGAAFSSWDGLLYDASSTILLRVPAGATEITIRDGCTTIAAGAMEGCAKLERINAPATVTSISPDVFQSVPTVSLPAQMAVQDATKSGVASGLPDQVKESTDSVQAEGEAEVSPRRVVASSQGLEAPLALPDLGSTSASPSAEAEAQASSQDEASSSVASSLLDQANASAGSAPQLTAMVALSSADDDLPEVDPSSIEVLLLEGSNASVWEWAGFSTQDGSAIRGAEASLQEGSSYAAVNSYAIYPADCEIWAWDGSWVRIDEAEEERHQWVGFSGRKHIRFYQGKLWYAQLDGSSAGYVCFGGQDEEVLTVDAGSSPSNLSALAPSVSYVAYSPYTYFSINKAHLTFTVRWDANGGDEIEAVAAGGGSRPSAPLPERHGFTFKGWFTAPEGGSMVCGANEKVPAVFADATYYAQWERVDFDVGFDTDSEPGDADCPGEAKPDETINKDSGAVEIEDPKRPGYVFEGWAIPTEDGTEAVDQELVYQGNDGKWYVDASKLPDYADSDGKVQLTARWTSVISVDVPSSVTFYADLVTQGQESREGVADGAFGQSKVSNQSQVDLRVVGLESSAVRTEGSTLGADSILKKASAATPSTSTQKLLSLYPSTKQWTAAELQNPDAVGGSKAATAVDFDLDDILLEKSFKADDFTIAAGSTLNMGYRLNLAESGQQLDYAKLSTLSEGQSASIANVSYCFGLADPQVPEPTGSASDPLYVELTQDFLIDSGLIGYARPGTYGLSDIKAAANDLSAHGDDPTQSAYWPLYRKLLDEQEMADGTPGDGPYFQLEVEGAATSNGHLPVQLIGIAQDAKSDGTGKAGLTFQMRDIYAYDNTRSANAGGGSFNTRMNAADTNSGGWGRPTNLRNTLRSTFWGYLPTEVQAAIVGVDKYQQQCSGNTAAGLQKTMGETVWLPSVYEVFGASFSGYNESEGLAINGNAPFQYMAYQPDGTKSAPNTKAVRVYDDSAHRWWLRSASWWNDNNFCYMQESGSPGYIYAAYTYGVAPAFCL